MPVSLKITQFVNLQIKILVSEIATLFFSSSLLPSLLFCSLRREWEGKGMKEKRRRRHATRCHAQQ